MVLNKELVFNFLFYGYEFQLRGKYNEEENCYNTYLEMVGYDNPKQLCNMNGELEVVSNEMEQWVNILLQPYEYDLSYLYIYVRKMIYENEHIDVETGFELNDLKKKNLSFDDFHHEELNSHLFHLEFRGHKFKIFTVMLRVVTQQFLIAFFYKIIQFFIVIKTTNIL